MAQIKTNIGVGSSPSTGRSVILILLRVSLLASLGTSTSWAEDTKPAMIENILVFTDGGSLVTLTNNHRLLPTTCLFKGRVRASREAAPIDPVTAMIWYIETSRKHQANYLLANARYESLWAYQCSANSPATIPATE